MKPRVVFMGTPQFAASCLQALCETSVNVIGVYSQPARAAGRGKKPQATPVANLATRENIPVFTPERFADDSVLEELRSLAPDIILVVAYGLLLPEQVLAIPEYGCWNVHASLLPRWRGAAPIQRAILAGDTTTGVDIMRMSQGLDEGAILSRHVVAITPDCTAGSLHDGLALLGASALVEAIPMIMNKHPKLTPQTREGVCYAHKITKSEARLNWHQSAPELDRHIRAFTPWPGAFCFDQEGKRLKVLKASLGQHHANSAPLSSRTIGKVMTNGVNCLSVVCKEGQLDLLTVQPEGRKAMTIRDYLQGYKAEGVFT